MVPVSLGEKDFGAAKAFGAQLRADDCVRWARRVCPTCLAKSGRQRAAFELKAVTGCHLHGRSLLSSCPRCDRKLEWHVGDFFHCACGLDLRGAACERESRSQRMI